MTPEPLPEARCPLKVARRRYNEQEDQYELFVEVCGEPLFLELADNHDLLTNGTHELATSDWKVACAGGHVLLMPDDEGGGWEIPFQPRFLTEAVG